MGKEGRSECHVLIFASFLLVVGVFVHVIDFSPERG